MSDKNISEEMILGVDPGRSKTGLALVKHDGKICGLTIAFSETFIQELKSFCENKKIKAVILGDGTNSEKIAKLVKGVFPELPQYFIGEAYSTEEARKLYWKVNPPKGLKRLVPLGLLVPEEPLDAYAAVVQVRRWLEQNK